jgi:EAL domain-containing protein (putative c-di-GMP-specific phosphodiesterase class I)
MDLNTFLRKALEKKQKIDVGQFHLLNLDEVKTRAGDAWPNMRRRIVDSSVHFIEKRISGEDFLIACEEGFLLIFADPRTNPDEEIAEISRDLQAFFLGAEELSDIQIDWECDSCTPNDLVQMAAPAVAETPPPAPAKPAEPESASSKACQGAYLPIWDADKQAVSANRCFSKFSVDGRQIEGRRVIDMRMADVTHLELDQNTLRGSLDMFRAFFKMKKQVGLCLTVHHSTIETADGLRDYLEPLSKIPPQIRKTFMIKIDDLPHQDPSINPLLKQLREFGLLTIAEVPFGTDDLEIFKGAGVTIFSCAALKPVNDDSEGMLDHDAKALNNFVRAARELKALTMLDDVRELKTLKAGMASGVRFFTGQALVAEGHRPLPNRPLSMVDLYRINKAA